MFGDKYDYVLVLIMMMIFNDGEFYMQKWQWFNGACMYENVSVYVGEVLFEGMHYWVTCSCIHK